MGDHTLETVRRKLDALTRSELPSLDPPRIARALANAGATVAQVESGPELAAFAKSTGLSEPMVRWALQQTFGRIDQTSLDAVGQRLRRTPAEGPGAVYLPAPARLAVMIFAANVFTAPLSPLCVALLAGVRVAAKASSRDDRCLRVFKEALDRADPEVGTGLQVFSFSRGTSSLEDALLSRADVVGVWGSDRTLSELRARVAPTTEFVPHGHGLGVVWVPAEVLSRPAPSRATAEAVALDVAAYDQRGCFSPHTVAVEGVEYAEDFAALLHEALGSIAQRLPRGGLPVEVGAAQVQWRGVAEVRGRLWQGQTHAVSLEGEGPLRISPGYRNVQVIAVTQRERFTQALAPLGPHLKAVGVAGDDDARRRLARSLPAPSAPRVCSVGTMQTPPLFGLADGVMPEFGLVKRIQLEAG